MLAPRTFRASHPFVLAFVLLNINPQCLASNASLSLSLKHAFLPSSGHAYLFPRKRESYGAPCEDNETLSRPTKRRNITTKNRKKV